jgi:hypothetical protein
MEPVATMVKVESSSTSPRDSRLPPTSAVVAHGLEVSTTTMSDEKSGRGFRSAIDEEIAKFETQQRQKEEDREAAEKQLQEARAKARHVRDELITALLENLRDDFAAEGKVLPVWEIRPEGGADEFSATAATPALGADGAPVGYYTIKAKASVAERGVLLDSSVECSYFDPNSTAASKSIELHKESVLMILLTFDTEWSKNKMYSMAGAIQKHPPFDMQRGREWFQKQLRDCARKCVRAKLEQTIKN